MKVIFFDYVYLELQSAGDKSMELNILEVTTGLCKKEFGSVPETTY